MIGQEENSVKNTVGTVFLHTAICAADVTK